MTGRPAPERSRVHTYADPGSFTVALTVTDNGNASSAPASHIVAVTNTVPVAEFSSTVDHLAATFNAAQSSDSDGTIASYAWDFGDGKTGTGVNPTHTYALPGTYNVKLTVVDDDNASSAVVTHPVTATAVGTPTTVAADAFGRTVTGGWGNADTGGPWTKTAGTALSLSVGSGTGSMAPLKGATTSVALNSVSQLNTDSVLTMSLPKIVDGGGEFTSLGARQVGTNGYRVKVKVGSAGRVTLTLVRVVNNVETVIGPPTGVMLPAAVTLTANTQLKVRLNTQGTGPTSLNARAWLAGTTEPTAWQISATDSTAALQVAGSVFLSTYVSGSATFDPVVNYDDLAVTTP